MVKITVKMFGEAYRFDKTVEELIEAYAETQMGYMLNAVLDGDKDLEEVPTSDEYAEPLYEDIVGETLCEIGIDGVMFDYTFSDDVRFMTKVAIVDIIKKVYACTFPTL